MGKKTKKLKKIAVRGVRTGAATSLGHQLLDQMKKVLGDSYPEAFSSEPWKTLEPLLVFGALSLISDRLPKKVSKAVDMALEGEISRMIQGKLSSNEIGNLISSMASVATLYIKDGKKKKHKSEW